MGASEAWVVEISLVTPAECLYVVNPEAAHHCTSAKVKF
jgi:hypothetical protein